MSNKKTLFVIFSIAVVTSIFIAVRNSQIDNNGNTVKIGYFGPLTGPAAETSEQMFNAFRLAHTLQPSIGNKDIQVIYEDDGCDSAKAVNAAKKLIEIDKVDILVSGVCSGSTLAVAPIAEKYKKILFTPVSSSPKITNAGDYVFRVSGNSSQMAVAVSKLISNSLKYQKVSVLFENAEYTVGWKDSFVSEFQKNGQVTRIEGFGSKDTDLKTQILKLSSEKPDALILVANSAVSANRIADQLKQLNVRIPVVGNEYFAFRESVVNPNTEGYFVTLYKYNLDNPKLRSLTDEYKKNYNKEPGTEIYVAMTFDGYNVLRDIIDLCSVGDSNCYKKELYSVEGYEGASGVISIDEKGDTKREFSLKKIQQGKLVELLLD